MDQAPVTERTQQSVLGQFGAETGASAVLSVLARAASHEHEREVLRKLLTSAQANTATLADVAGPVNASATASHRLMASAAGRAFVPVLIAFEAEQTRAVSGISADVPHEVAASIRLRAEVLRGLAATSRQRYSGNFRAAVFGANDGLVSNLALVVGMSATGVSAAVVLAAGMAGLIAGALSMAAGEYISVRSARELLQASRLKPEAVQELAADGVPDAEISLIFRARGIKGAQDVKQSESLGGSIKPTSPSSNGDVREVGTDHVIGQAWGAAMASFFFFASGALIPILPYLIGLGPTAAILVAIVLVGVALLTTGATVGVLSGASAMRRALRQLTIGYGAATVTYLLGLAFGAVGVG